MPHTTRTGGHLLRIEGPAGAARVIHQRERRVAAHCRAPRRSSTCSARAGEPRGAWARSVGGNGSKR